MRTTHSPYRKPGWSLVLAVPLLAAALAWQAAPAAAQGDDARMAVATSVVQWLHQGEYDRIMGVFDAQAQRAINAAALKQAWEGITAQVGPFKRVVSVEKQDKGGLLVATITCEFEKAQMAVAVGVNRANQVSLLQILPAAAAADWTAPQYADPETFTEREVVVGEGEWALPGTLTMPKGEGPFPALVLVHGSGPNDRDETLGPNKPFRDLAWGLATRGIAVLRYEKRTKAHGEKMAAMPGRLTLREETVEDAWLAATLLRQTEGVDPKQVFVLGHSLGGMAIPRIGAGDPELAGLIVMAGTTRPLEDVIIEQITYLSNLDGDISPQEQAKIDELRAQAARVKDPNLSLTTPADQLPLGGDAVYWLDLRGYDPPQAARDLPRPMLVLHGGRDYQVTMADYQRWTDALSGRADVTFKLYPTLNHLMIAGEGVCTPEEYLWPGHVAPEVVDDIATWIEGIRAP